LEHATGPTDLVLDFFAGSGSTGQAVLELNRDDGGRRRCILVQLPEPLEEGKYDTIAAITRDRMRRVAQRLRGTAALPNGQLGFRAFKLAPAALPSWPDQPCADVSALEAQLEAQVAGPAEEVPSGDLLFEVQARAGVRLDRPVQVVELEGIEAFDIDDGALLICLALTLEPAGIRAMLDRGPARLILREAVFQGDDALRLECVRWAEQSSVELRTV
jgi:adenine-specific DNA-methyltransferase